MAECFFIRRSARVAEESRACVPIRDYALIGDCHGAALVARNGGIDWCCLERFDAEPILWRLLDSAKGAFFHIAPEDALSATRAYLPDTNILETTFTTSSGRVSVIDFMPVGRSPESAVDDYTTLNAPGWLIRIVEVENGEARVRVAYRPGEVAFSSADRLASHLLFSDELPAGRPSYEETLHMRAGEQRAFVAAAASASACTPARHAKPLLEVTRAFWREWCARCRYKGPYGDAVRRSALTLKALTYAPSGAIVAAPSTSLPEEPGGIRNWDYRFSWLRDSSFVLHSLAALGYSGEARRFCEFLRLCCVRTLPSLQILYGIQVETEVPERCLDHLAGYAGAKPVRVGNAAYCQKQIDIYGELADWALLYRELGEPIDATLEAVIRGAADHAAEHRREPDQGIWEMRGPPRHHVHGKAMAWVALDRALRLLGENETWERARSEILDAVREHGIDKEAGHLVQAFGERDVDAALLLLPLLDIPLGAEVLRNTVAAVQEHLGDGDYVHRYLTSDGLPGGEGAFLICSFWLVDALLILGRADEAKALYERLLEKTNDVGLFSEEIDPKNGAFLGNHPQAFTHLALVNSAALLELHEMGGTTALAGTHADRAKRSAALADHGKPMRRDLQREARIPGNAASVLRLPGA